jgi:Protein of unknown function (DUF1367)
VPEIDLVMLPDGKLRGWREADEKAWQKFKRAIKGLEAGECVKIEWKKPRNPRFHRKMFALLNLGFEAWTPDRKHFSYKGRVIEKDFDRFRRDVVIQAGFFRQVFDSHGRMILEAESLSYSSMDDERFEVVYSAVAQVLLERVLTNYTKDDLETVVESLMKFTA